MIAEYSVAGLAAVLLTLAARSHKPMNLVSIAHSAAAFALGMHVLQAGLPVSYLQNGYFFADSLTIFEVLLSSAMFLLASIYASGYVESLIRSRELDRKYVKAFYVAFNLLLSATMLAFFSNNLALLWIFVEMTTLFAAFLIVILNTKENIGAALKYVFLSSTAMLFTFVGLIFLFALSRLSLGEGSLNWDFLVSNAPVLPPALVAISFGFIFIGFAAKSGIVPFHTWLPDAYSRSPSVISAILSAVISNIGIYGILRVYAIAKQTDAAPALSQMMMAFGILSMAVAVFSMLRQEGLKKLIAFSSIENAGFALVGIGIGTPVALFWVLLHGMVHSMAKALLFFSTGVLHMQYESNNARRIVNALVIQPLGSWGLIIGSVAIIGMPPFALFLPKFFMLSELASVSVAALVAVAVLLLVGAAAFALFLTRIMSQTSSEGPATVPVPAGMKMPIVLLALLVALLGLLMPQALMGIIESAAQAVTGGI